MTNCANKGNVRGTNYVGGIFGDSEIGYVTDCYNTGTIDGSERVGGIGGRAMRSTRCWNAGQVTGVKYVAGIFGEATFCGSTSSSITSSFNAGSISGKTYVGGILGYSTVYSGYYPSSISNCYNVGELTGTGEYVGGIAGQGWLCAYTNCYNAGICSLGNGPEIGAIFNYGARGESSNVHYLRGCCGENYQNIWGAVVQEKGSDEMRDSSFVSTLNNGGTAWVQDTENTNLGYPILSGIDYTSYRDYIINSEIYRFKISGNRQTNCLAVGDVLEVDVACFLHNTI